MEDISRALDQEIVRTKPSRYKSGTDKNILIIDDLGEISSGEHFKSLVRWLSVISLAGILCSVILSCLYFQTRQENRRLVEKTATVEKKNSRLTNEKELLMARLVMLGEKPDLTVPKESKITDSDTAAAVEDEFDKKNKLEKGGLGLEFAKGPVSIERFSVTRGENHSQLTIRFSVRNISTQLKEVSGRIFTVLKPDPKNKEEWVVVPGGKMENGRPAPFSKGKYFSITRFKPLAFSINSQVSPEVFKTAEFFVFGDDEKLLFKNTIQINGH